MAFGKKKPQLGMYQEQKDTPWITRNRELNTDVYGNLSRDLNRVNVFDDATRQQLNAYNDSIYNRAVKDFDRDYAQTMNRYLARDYDRFGTTGGSSSLLTRDNYNLAQQRKLADLEYQRGLNYEDMVNQELSRRYNWLNLNNQLFRQTGDITQAFDNANWKIRNQNVDRRYTNDLQRYNEKAGLMNLGANALGVALAPFTGGTSLLIGNALGGVLGAEAGNLLAGQAGSNVDAGITNAMKNLGYYGGQSGKWNIFKDYASNLQGDTVPTNRGYSNVLDFLASQSSNLDYDNWLRRFLNNLQYGSPDLRGGFGSAGDGYLFS